MLISSLLFTYIYTGACTQSHRPTHMHLNWLTVLKVSQYLIVIQKLTSIRNYFLAERENKSRVLLHFDSSTEIQKA